MTKLSSLLYNERGRAEPVLTLLDPSPLPASNILTTVRAVVSAITLPRALAMIALAASIVGADQLGPIGPLAPIVPVVRAQTADSAQYRGFWIDTYNTKLNNPADVAGVVDRAKSAGAN